MTDLALGVVPSILNEFPPFFQGGMGAGVSRWWLARMVAILGGVGTLSSAALRSLIIEAVRNGDEKVIAMAKTFPFPQHIAELLAFAPGGKMHKSIGPMDQAGPKGERARRLSTIASFTEVSLAKEGHRGKMAENVMWKIPQTVLPTIYGAMLAGIDLLACGAGVPMELAEIVLKIRRGESLYYAALYGTGTSAELQVIDGTAEFLERFERPKLAVILSNFAFCGKIKENWWKNHRMVPDFIVIEGYEAGGHNAPPRNKREHTEEEDGVETYFNKVLALGIPVIVAGAFKYGGNRKDLRYWRRKGAYGIQVGSRFALCEESPFLPKVKKRIIANNRRGRTKIVTSKRSPTGYPWKEVQLNGTLSSMSVYNKRKRRCLYGYLRKGHKVMVNGKEIEVLTCPAMPVETYIRLHPEKTRAECLAECAGVICLCEALPSNVGVLSGPPTVTLGLSGKLAKKHLTVRQIMEDILTPRCVAQSEKKLLIT